MAANLTPQYHDAEEKYRAARTPEEQLAGLEEMWRELPKHKSTEKLQAELKKKLSGAREAVQHAARKGGGPSRVDPFAIPKSGAGQVALIGTPNVGKSSIVGGLTHAHVKIADFPFSTATPVPGMAQFENVQIQLIDTPPITAEHVPTGFPGLWWSADALLVVADLSSDALLDDVETCLRHLAERKVELTDGPRERPNEAGGLLRAPGFIIANKLDAAGAGDNLEVLREFFGSRVRIEPFSACDPDSLKRLPEMLFKLLRVIRIYAKPPGRKADMDEPFLLHAGADVHVLAGRVHRGLENQIKSARIWGHGVADGQHVQLHHVLQDGDVVELHA